MKFIKVRLQYRDIISLQKPLFTQFYYFEEIGIEKLQKHFVLIYQSINKFILTGKIYVEDL